VGIHIEKVDLPGIGVRHDLVTEGGRRISVVSHRDGERDLGVFDVDDPDACRDSIPLSDDEAAALADVLGASVMLSRLTSLSDETAGLYTEQIALPTDSPYLNRTLATPRRARARTRPSSRSSATRRSSPPRRRRSRCARATSSWPSALVKDSTE
jgi:TrkA domain protein